MSWWMWLIVIILGIGFIQKTIDDVKNKTSSKTSGSGSTTDRTDLYFWPVDTGETCITGTSYYQPALKTIAGEHGQERAEVYCLAHIIPDDENAHDNLAVRIDINGRTVGHLPRDDARSFRKRLSRKKMGLEPTQCVAKVWGGFNSGGNPSEYGVDIFITPFSA